MPHRQGILMHPEFQVLVLLPREFAAIFPFLLACVR